MRYANVLLVVLIAVCLISGSRVECLAMDTGFTTEMLSEEDKKTFLNNIKISYLECESKKDAIECFDVNEKGLIVLGHETSNDKKICIYTSEGEFQYGCSFECTGKFGVEFDGDNVIIYFVRSDVAVEINSKGEVENVLKIQDTIENNSYWNNSVFQNKRTQVDREYVLKNDMGILNLLASSYSQLVIIDNSGNEEIIYDVNSEQLSGMLKTFVVIFVFVFIVLCTVVVALIKGLRKYKKLK
ncbi:MAG: hypothetical protein IJB96_04215 [Lachnospira sp.]|nr:hypothetical protein [Lachnospira sp.]